jgi:xanthine dehydrogenase YagS FAD-binding subunit
MNNFGYLRAASIDDAIAQAQSRRTSQYIAGGTELLNWIRLGIVAPDHLIDLGTSGASREIKRDGDELIIGALATLNEVGQHDLTNAHATALAQACLKAASGQVRNRATLGGNVLQKTRCTYFRSESPLPWGCNKRVPGSGCAALTGLNERHAILGATDACVAVHPSDPLVALACLDAEADLIGPRGRRTISMRTLHLTQEEARTQRSAPMHEAQLETRLRPYEIITRYRIPLTAQERSAYVKVRERESYEYALVSAAASVRVEAGKITQARVALGSVAQRPWRLQAAEQALIGAALTKEAVLPHLQAALREAKPLQHNAYKVTMAANAATRALLLAGALA